MKAYEIKVKLHRIQKMSNYVYGPFDKIYNDPDFAKRREELYQEEIQKILDQECYQVPVFTRSDGSVVALKCPYHKRGTCCDKCDNYVTIRTFRINGITKTAYCAKEDNRNIISRPSRRDMQHVKSEIEKRIDRVDELENDISNDLDAIGAFPITVRQEANNEYILDGFRTAMCKNGGVCSKCDNFIKFGRKGTSNFPFNPFVSKGYCLDYKTKNDEDDEPSEKELPRIKITAAKRKRR